MYALRVELSRKLHGLWDTCKVPVNMYYIRLYDIFFETFFPSTNI
jgi:hypothetical protein